MSIESVSSSPAPVQRPPEASEIKETRRAKDTEPEQVAPRPPAPTVNTSGEKIGQVINTVA
jgi:hypothetical protein